MKTSKSENESLIGKLEAELTLKQEELNLLLTDRAAKEAEFANIIHENALCPKIDDINQLPIGIKQQQNDAVNDNLVPQSEVSDTVPIATGMADCQKQSSSFISDESELEEAIELVVSSTKNSVGADSTRCSNSCKTCSEMRQYVKRINSLTLENNKLKAQLDASHLSPVSPDCSRDTTNVPSTPRSNCARPVDLETLFRATPRRTKVDSTSPSHCSQTDITSDLKESLKEATRSRDKIDEMHEHLLQQHHKLEKDLNVLNAEKNSLIVELEQASSLVSLLESSQESLSSSKLQAEQERNELKSRAEYLAKQLRETKSELELTRSKLHVSHDTVKTLEDKIRLLEIDRDSIIQKLNMLERECLHLQGEIDLIVDEKNRQEKRIKELLLDLTTMEGEKAELEETIFKQLLNLNDLRHQLQQKETTADESSQSIDTMDGDRFSHFERLERVESQLHLATASNQDTLDVSCGPELTEKIEMFQLPDQFSTAEERTESLLWSSPQLQPDMRSFESTPLTGQHLSPYVNKSSDQSFEGPSIQTDHDGFRSIASILSVIVLQQKLRAARAESKLEKLGDELANTEMSLGEINADRRKLVEEIILLKQENQTLLEKLSDSIMSRQSSEALVLEGESCVETVDCTTYSSTHIHEAKLEKSLCNRKLQSTVGSLALALVKLKIRERSLVKENKKLAHNEQLLLDRQGQIEKRLSDIGSQMVLISSCMVELKNEAVVHLRATNECSTDALSKLHSSATHLRDKAEQLLSEKHNLEKQVDASTGKTNELQSQNSELLLENCRVVEMVSEKNQAINELEQQVEALNTQLTSKEEQFTQVMMQLRKDHEREKQDNAESIASLKSGADDSVNELKFYLLHEKEASSLLRAQLENSISEKAAAEISVKTLEEERNRLLETITSLEEETSASTSILLDYQDTIAKLKSCESKLELSEKLRLQLQSQLDDETNVLNQTVTSQAATIEMLNANLQSIAHERDTHKDAMSSLNCKVLSLASERDSLSAQLTTAANEYNVLKSENTNLKHELSVRGNQSDRTDCSVRTYSSCEHVGTVCEEQRLGSPNADLIDILSAPQLSKKDVEAVSDKMRQLHTILSQVQEERSSLKHEVKHLREFKESSSDLVSREEVELLLRKNSESFRSHLVQSQNEISRLTRELESRDQPRITKFTTPFSTAADGSSRPQFEVSLETPRVSNMATKHTSKLSPRYRKQKSPKEPSKVRSKERFEVKNHSIFNLFKDSKKSGRKEFIKYRDNTKDSRSVNSSEPISPGEKRKREQAELMIKSLRRKYEI